LQLPIAPGLNMRAHEWCIPAHDLLHFWPIDAAADRDARNSAMLRRIGKLSLPKALRDRMTAAVIRVGGCHQLWAAATGGRMGALAGSSPLC
jgi:hypothetical protein